MQSYGQSIRTIISGFTTSVKDASEGSAVAAPRERSRPSYHHIDDVDVDDVQMTRSHKIEAWIALLVAIVLVFRPPQYHPLYLNDFVTSKLYVVHLVPLTGNTAPENQPEVKVANVRVRYTDKAMTELNVGSAVKTFEVENKGNVPCKGQSLCSPDGKWKAAVGSATLDAGMGNAFRNARASCIAGPCPFTKIEAERLSQGDQIITASARDWSETATFLLEAEVFRPVMSQKEHWSYPVIFGETLSFTLPSAAESVSIEADLDRQTIIFPLGPSLFLSWATCNAAVNPDQGRIYRCTPKPGYRFQ